MTAGRIALLWIVLVAAWPVLNLNDPLRPRKPSRVMLRSLTWWSMRGPSSLFVVSTLRLASEPFKTSQGLS